MEIDFSKFEKSLPIHAEQMAAKNMGVSHQTVSSAKKVVTEGIHELRKIVEDGHEFIENRLRYFHDR